MLQGVKRTKNDPLRETVLNTPTRMQREWSLQRRLFKK